MDNLDDFLRETKFCNFSDDNIRDLAEKIGKNCKNDRDFAVSAFYWVRDNILYRVGNWQRKASETLAEKSGTCTNKSNLLVALLRCRRIPSGYGVLKVYGQRYFGPVAIKMLNKFVGKISTHVYTVVYLDGKWIKCDPDVDIKFCQNTSYFNPNSKLMEWDGYNDALLDLSKDVVDEKFPVDNIDPWMEKKSKNAKGLFLKISNIYIDFLRNNGKRVAGAEEMADLFKQYMKKKHPVYYYAFILFYKPWKRN